MIKLAAEDNRVTRIFVNPAIKKQLCLDAGSDREWLRKVRPWFRHRAHMHVRLCCPPGSRDCVDQPALPPGDGCGAELESWFLPAKPGTGAPVKKTLPPLPAAYRCSTGIWCSDKQSRRAVSSVPVMAPR